MLPPKGLLQIFEDFRIGGVEKQNFSRIFWRFSVELFVNFDPGLLRLDVGQAQCVEGVLVFSRHVVMVRLKMPAGKERAQKGEIGSKMVENVIEYLKVGHSETI